VHKCELSYMCPGNDIKLHPHRVKLYIGLVKSCGTEVGSPVLGHVLLFGYDRSDHWSVGLYFLFGKKITTDTVGLVGPNKRTRLKSGDI